MTNSVDFSVVIPMFNNETQIVETINSVISQSHAPREILVIDDGSTDNSTRIVRTNFGAAVQLHVQRNSGPGSARNLGLANSKSDWVAFIDGDDLWANEHLQCLAAAVSKFSDSALVASRHFCVDEGAPFDWPSHGDTNITIRRLDFFANRNFSPFQTSAVAVRRDTLLKLGGFADTRLGEDVDCWARIALHYPMAFVERSTVAHLQRSSSLMGQVQGRVAASFTKQPIFTTLTNAIKQTDDPVRKEALRVYHAHILTILLKQALVDANAPIARQIMSEMKALNYRPPLSMSVLLFLGPRTIAAFARIRAVAKRARDSYAA